MDKIFIACIANRPKLSSVIYIGVKMMQGNCMDVLL